MKSFDLAIRWLLPPDPSVIMDLIDLDDPARTKTASRFAMELKWWYWKVTAISIASVIFMPWAYINIAQAGDTESKVMRAVAPVQTQLATLTGVLYEQLAASTADRICLLVKAMESEQDTYEQRRLRGEIDREQSKYRMYTNRDRDYNEARCPGVR